MPIFKLTQNKFSGLGPVVQSIVTLMYLDTSVFRIYLLKQKRFIVPDGIQESYPGKNIYRKDPKFLHRSSGQTVQTEISLTHRHPSDKVNTVAIPSALC